MIVSQQLTVLGTPAEEDGGGKIDMIREDAFEGLDVVFMAHPSQEDATYLPCVAEHEYVFIWSQASSVISLCMMHRTVVV